MDKFFLSFVLTLKKEGEREREIAREREREREQEGERSTAFVLKRGRLVKIVFLKRKIQFYF